MVEPKPQPKTVLKVIHNAGFFSMFTIRLMDILAYFNQNKELPDEVDSTSQFIHFKSYAGENLVPYYWNEGSDEITYKGDIVFRFDCMAIQFAPYNELKFKQLSPFIEKYFKPSNHVGDRAFEFTKNHGIDLDNTCAVFYRGNDKETETPTAGYQFVIDKAKEIQRKNPGINFFLLPDECEFMRAFKSHFPDTITISEIGCINRNPSTAVFYELRRDERKNREASYYAGVLIASRCKHLITHSGNGGLWSVLYRGNTKNVHQYFDGKWIM